MDYSGAPEKVGCLGVWLDRVYPGTVPIRWGFKDYLLYAYSPALGSLP